MIYEINENKWEKKKKYSNTLISMCVRTSICADFKFLISIKGVQRWYLNIDISISAWQESELSSVHSNYIFTHFEYFANILLTRLKCDVSVESGSSSVQVNKQQTMMQSEANFLKQQGGWAGRRGSAETSGAQTKGHAAVCVSVCVSVCVCVCVSPHG